MKFLFIFPTLMGFMIPLKAEAWILSSLVYATFVSRGARERERERSHGCVRPFLNCIKSPVKCRILSCRLLLLPLLLLGRRIFEIFITLVVCAIPPSPAAATTARRRGRKIASKSRDGKVIQNVSR